MPRFSIPSQRTKRWKGIFQGEDFGEIWSARAIDLERNKGKIGLADAYSEVFDSGDDADLTNPIAFVRSSADNTDRYWANGGKLFKTSGTNPESGWTQDAIGSSPSAPLHDMIDFAGDLIVPTSTNLDRLVSGTWNTDFWSGLSGASAMTSNPHRFAILAGALLITDGRFVNDFDGTIARDPAITLPTGFIGQGIVTFGELAFVFGSQPGGGETFVYTWDRTATNYIARYPVGDTEILCAFVIDSVYIVTKKGLIKRFNGIAFETIQQFPTVEAQESITSIHPNGVSVTENIAKMIVNFGVISNDRLVSGLWNFDSVSGNLYNAGSVRNTTTRDFGQYELADVGALKQTVVGQGLYLAGAQVYTVYTGTTVHGIFTSDEDGTNNQGYFISSKLRAPNVQAFWRLIFAHLRNMTSADDRFRIAIRTSDSNELPAYETITWVTASTFTASNSDIAVGDFVEVLAGENAGAIARITNISGGTVTIDRSLFASTADARVRYLRFTDLGTISNVQVVAEIFHSTQRGTFLQMLIEFRGTRTSPLLEKLIIDRKDLRQIV